MIVNQVKKKKINEAKEKGIAPPLPKKKNVRPPERKRKKDYVKSDFKGEKVLKPEPGLESEQSGPEWEPVPEPVHDLVPEPVHEPESVQQPESELEKQDTGDESSQGKQ